MKNISDDIKKMNRIGITTIYMFKNMNSSELFFIDEIIKKQETALKSFENSLKLIKNGGEKYGIH